MNCCQIQWIALFSLHCAAIIEIGFLIVSNMISSVCGHCFFYSITLNAQNHFEWSIPILYFRWLMIYFLNSSKHFSVYSHRIALRECNPAFHLNLSIPIGHLKSIGYCWAVNLKSVSFSFIIFICWYFFLSLANSCCVENCNYHKRTFKIQSVCLS